MTTNIIKQRRKPFSKATISIVMFLLPALLACGGFGSSVNVQATVAAGVAATQQAEADLQATIQSAIAATQAAQAAAPGVEPAPAPPSGPATATPAPQQAPPLPDPQQVRNVILNEVNGTVAQDLALLQQLYAPEAVITDHNGTPAEPGDDTIWQGWANIERRYRAFFSTGVNSINLVDLAIQLDGEQATGTHQGVVLDGTLYPDRGVYTLEQRDGQWLITRLEYGNEAGLPKLEAAEGTSTAAQSDRDDGLYVLEVGSQHRYEEPWGWDRGDPCEAWERGDFDDTQPNYRGFNVELLLTNHSDSKAPDAWPVSFTTAQGKAVKACYYGYQGSGPEPGATSSVTFFTVVEKGDYVEQITLSLKDQTVQLCLDGKGGWARC